MAENDRPLVIYRLKERGWGPQIKRCKNNEYSYHIFDSSTMSSNRRLPRPTSVIDLQSRILSMGTISKQATKQLGPDLFFCASFEAKIVSFAKCPCNIISQYVFATLLDPTLVPYFVGDWAPT